jgi:AbrB family looped-hinge helix DNA binding protein
MLMADGGVAANCELVVMRFVRKVNDRGVLTLPSEVREALDVADGDIVEFEVLRIVKKAKPSKGKGADQPSPTPAAGDAS